MRHRLVFTLIIILIFSLSACTGKQLAPEQQYLAASESFNLLVKQYKAEKEKQPLNIFNEWVEDYDPLLFEGKRLLDTWGLFIKVGDYDKSELSAKEYMDFKNALIDILGEVVFKEGGAE